MALWGYWSTAPPPKFPAPPRNPLVYCSVAPSESVPVLTSSHAAAVSEEQPSFEAGYPSAHELEDFDREPSHDAQVAESLATLEEVEFANFHSPFEREEHSEYKLLVKRYVAKELVKSSIDRWRESLTWLPADVPTSLEIGPVQSIFVPVYLYSAQLDLTCIGKYDLMDGNTKEEAESEITVKDDLNEIFAYASTEPATALMDELFDAKAFVPPTSTVSSNSPSVPRHSFHPVRYRSSLFSPALTTGSVVLPCDIPESLANNMISEYLIHSAGPFLATQAFKAKFGSDARSLSTSVSIRSLVRHLLFLPLYCTSYEYHNHSYLVLVSGINGHVAGQRMSYGTGSFGRALVSLSSGLSNVLHKNM